MDWGEMFVKFIRQFNWVILLNLVNTMIYLEFLAIFYSLATNVYSFLHWIGEISTNFNNNLVCWLPPLWLIEAWLKHVPAKEKQISIISWILGTLEEVYRGACVRMPHIQWFRSIILGLVHAACDNGCTQYWDVIVT